MNKYRIWFKNGSFALINADRFTASAAQVIFYLNGAIVGEVYSVDGVFLASSVIDS